MSALKRKSDAFVKSLVFSAVVRIQFLAEIEVIGPDGEENIIMAIFEFYAERGLVMGTHLTSSA